MSLALVLCTGYFTTGTLHAATGADTWKGGSYTNLNTNNWTGANTTPLSGDSWIFNTAGQTLNNDLAQLFSVAGITFGSSAGAFTFGGSTITLTAGVTNQAISAQIFNNAFVLGGNVTNTTAAGGGNLRFNGNISGGFGLSFTGAGTTTLAASNSFTGSSTLTTGVLQSGNTYAFGTGTLNVNGGTLDLNGNNTAISTLGAGAAAGTITDLSAGAGITTLSLTNYGSGVYVASQIIDGANKKVALQINGAGASGFGLANSNNTFSGGITLTGSLKPRLAVNNTFANSLTNGIFGTGTITIGTNATDYGQLFFVSNANTIYNPIAYNTTNGADTAGAIRVATALTLAGTQIAAAAPVNMLVGGSTATITGLITGTNALGLWLSAVTANISNTVSTNNFTGYTRIDSGATLNLYSGGLGSNGIVLLNTASASGATLGVYNTTNQTISNSLLGQGSITLLGTGTTTFANAGAFISSGLSFGAAASNSVLSSSTPLYLLSGSTIANTATGGNSTNSVNAAITFIGGIGNYSVTSSATTAAATNGLLALNGNITSAILGSSTLTLGGNSSNLQIIVNGNITDTTANLINLFATSGGSGSTATSGAAVGTGVTVAGTNLVNAIIVGGTQNYGAALALTGSNNVRTTATVNGQPGGGANSLLVGGANGFLNASNGINVNYAGNLIYDNSVFNGTNRFGSSTVTLNGGTLGWKLNATATNTSAFVNQLTLGGGFQSLLADNALSSGTNTLTIGSLTGGGVNGATLYTTLPNAANATSGRVIVTTPQALVGGILPWAVDSSSGAFLTYSNSGTANYLGGYGSVSNNVYQTGASSGWASTDNVKLTTGTTTVASGKQSVNSLTFIQAAATTLDLGGLTFTDVSGGILSTGGFASVITNGTITAGTGSATNLYLWNTTATTNAQTLAATIADNGSGAISLIKAGAGTTVLTASNSYSGQTLVEAGTLTLTNSGSFNKSSAAVVNYGATLNVGTTNPGTIASNLTVNGTLGVYNASGSLALTGINGSGSGVINSYGTYSGVNSVITTGTAGNLLNFVGGSYFTTFSKGAGSYATLTESGSGTVFLGTNTTWGGSATNTQTIFSGGTWQLGNLGNNSGTGDAGTNIVTNNATVITGSGRYGRDTWIVGQGTLVAGGSDRIDQGANSGNPPLQYIVNTGGVMTAYNLGYGVTFGAGVWSGSTNPSFNGLVVNGGTFIESGGGGPSLQLGAATSVTNNNANLAETNLLTVTNGGSAFIGGNLTAGAASTAAMNTGATLQQTNVITLTGSASQLSVAGTISAGMNNGLPVNAFVWNGGNLSAGTIVAATNGWSSTYVGNTISNNTLSNAAGKLTPGTVGVAGKTAITGGYFQSNNGVLALDAYGTNAANAFTNGGIGSSYYDQLTVSGSATLSGTIYVNPVLTATSATTLSLVTGTSLLTNSTTVISAANITGGTNIWSQDGISYYNLTNVGGTNLSLVWTGVNQFTNGIAGNYNWGTTTVTNAWSSAINPGSNTTGLYGAFFGTNSGVAPTVTLTNNVSLTGLYFNSTNAAGYTLTNSGGAAITLKSAYGNATNGNISQVGLVAFAGANTITPNITFNTNLVFGGAGTLVLTGTLSDGGTANNLYATNTGLVVLTGNNSLLASDTLTLGAGSGNIQIGTNTAAGTLGAAAVTGGAGTLTFNRSDLYVLTNAFSGSVNLVQGGSGTLQFASSTNLGSVALSASNGVIDLNGQSVVAGSLGIGATNGTITDNSAGSGTTTLSLTNAVGSTAGMLLKDGASKKLALQISSTNNNSFALTNTNNTYSGGTILSGAGKLRIAINSSTYGTNNTATSGIFGTGAITLGTNTTDLVQIFVAVNNNLTLYNAINYNTALGTDTAGSFRLQANTLNLYGTQTANLAAINFGASGSSGIVNLYGQLTGSNNTYGLWVPNNGTMTVNVNNLNSGAAGTNNYIGMTRIDMGQTLNLISGGLGTNTIENLGTFGLNTTNYTLSNFITGVGTLFVNGSGTNTLAGSNNYTGGTVLNSGVTRMGNSAALGTGAVNFASNASIQAGAGMNFGNAATVASGVTGTLDAGGYGLTNVTSITGSGNVGISDTVGGGTVTFASNQAYTGATFVAAGGNLVLNSGITLASSGITNAGTLLVNNTLGSITNGAGTATIATGGVVTNATLSGGSLLVNGSATGITQSGGALTVAGAGTAGSVTLSGGSAMVNGTAGTVTATGGLIGGSGTLGTLTVSGSATVAPSGAGASAAANLKVSSLVLNGGIFNLNLFSGTSIDTITSSGGITFGNNPITLAILTNSFTSWDQTQSNSYTIFSGTTPLSGTFSTNNISFSGSSAVSGKWSVTTNATSLILVYSANSTTITVSSDTGTLYENSDSSQTTPFSGDSAPLQKVGAGEYVLNMSNSYGGNTYIAAGTLTVATNGGLGVSPTVFLGYSTNNAPSGSNSVLQIANAGQTVSQGITIAPGSAQYAVLNSSGGTVVLAGGLTLTTNATLSNTVGGNLLVNSAITGAGLNVSAGSGTVTLAAGSSYIGGTTLNGGTLALSNNLALGMGTLSLSSSATVQALTNENVGNNVSVAAGGNTLTIDANGNALTNSGNISGSGANLLVRDSTGKGTLTLSGSNSYTGASTVNSGTLALGSANALPSGASLIVSKTGTLNVNGYGISLASLNSASGGVVTNSAATTNLITVSNSTASTYNGVLAGNLSLTEVGGGTLTLGGVDTYTGTTVVGSNSSIILSTTGLLGAGNYSNTISIGTNGSLVLGQSGSQTLSGVVSGAGSLSASGTGTVVIATNNTYSGGTMIANGSTIQVGTGVGSNASTGLGTNSVTDNGNLFFNFATTNGSTVTISNVISGSGTVTLLNSNVGMTSAGFAGIFLNQSNGFASMVVNGGTVIGTNDFNFGASNGTITLNGAVLANATNLGNLTLGAARTIILGSNGGYIDNNYSKIVTINSQITGSGGLSIVFDGGSTVLGGSNNYAGPTTIGTYSAPYAWSASTASASLYLSNNNALPTGTALVFGASEPGFINGETLYLNGFNATVGSISGTNGSIRDNAAGASTLTIALNGTNASFAGGIYNGGTGLQSLIVSGTGTQTLSGTNSFSGGAVLSGGVVNMGNSSALGSGVVSMSGGALTFDSGVTNNSFSLGGLAGSGNISMTNTTNGAISLSVGANNSSNSYAGNLTDGGVGSSLTKLGNNTLTLSGNNSYTGGTFLNAGVLGLGSANAIASSGPLTFNGGTLQYSSVNTTDYSGLFSTNGSQAFKFDLNGQNITFASGITNGGTTTLSVTNSTLGGGTLTLAGVNAFSGNITDYAALNLANIGSQTLSGTISGSGTLIQSGSGTTTLTASSSGFSNTVVNAGALNLQNSSANSVNGRNGTIAGTLTINSGGTVNLISSNAIGYGGSGYNAVTNITINGGTLNDAFGLTNAAMGFVATITMTGGTVASTTNGSAFNFGVGTGVNTLATNISALFSDNITLRGTGVTFNTAQGTVPSGFDLIVSGSIGQNGVVSINKTGLGIMELTASNSFSGASTITQGTLDLANSNALFNSVITLNGGTAAFDASVGTNFSIGGIASTGATNLVLTNTAGSALNLTLGNGNNAAIFLGNLSDNGLGAAITKVGTGTQTFAGVNNGFTGTLTINGGTIYLSNSINQTLGGNIILAGGVLNQNGSGTTTLTGSLSNTTNGTPLVVSGGALAFNNSFALTNAALTIQNGGQALFTNGTVNTFGVTTNNYNTFSFNGTNGSLGATPTLLVSNGSVLSTMVNTNNNSGGWGANTSAIVIGSNSAIINSANSAGYSMDGGSSVQIAQSGLFSNQVYQFKIGTSGAGTNVISNAGTVLMTLGNPSGLVVGNGAGGLNEILNSGTFGNNTSQNVILGASGVTNNATNLFFNYAGATFSNNGGMTIGQGQSSLNELSNSGTMTFGANVNVGYGTGLSGTNLVYLNGGSLTITNGTLYIGAGGPTTNIVTVDNGATLKLIGGVMGSSGAANNQLNILSGGKVIMSSQFYLNYGTASGSSNQVTVNAGAIFTNSSSLQYQSSSGANSNSVIFTNSGGLVFASSINEGWGNTNTANLSVYGQGSGTTTLNNNSYVGQGVSTNNTNQIIVSGGLFTNSSSLTLGNAGTSNNNLLLVSGGTFYGGINNIGAAGTNNINSFLFSGATSSNSQALAIGSGGLNNSNGATISSGSFTESSTIAVGSGGTNNTNNLLISGGSVSASGNITIGSGGSNNVNILQLTGGSLTTPGTIAAGTSSNIDGFIFTGGTLVASNITATGSNWTAANSSISNNTFYNTNAGVLAPGTVGIAGKLNITGNYVQGSSAAIAIDLNGTAPAISYQSFPGSYYDTVAVSSNATLAGDLLLTIGNGGTAAASGNSFSVVTASNVTGMFNGVHTSLVNGVTKVVATDGLSVFTETNTGKALNLINYTLNQYAGGFWGSGGNSSWTAVDPNSGVYTAYFGTNGGSGAVVLDQTRTVSGLIFSNAVASSLTASGGVVLNLTNNAGVTTNASLTVISGGLTVAARVNLQSGLVIADTAGGGVNFTGNISESVAGSGVTIAANNTGLVTFFGTNSYTGATVVNGGYLDLTGTNALAAAKLNSNNLSVGRGATLIFGVGGSNAYSSAQINGALASGAFKAGSGVGYDATGTNYNVGSLAAVSSLTLAGSGTATVNQDNSNLTGGIALLGGTLAVDPSTATTNALGGANVVINLNTTNASKLDLGGTAQSVGNINNNNALGGVMVLTNGVLTIAPGNSGNNATFAGLQEASNASIVSPGIVALTTLNGSYGSSSSGVSILAGSNAVTQFYLQGGSLALENNHALDGSILSITAPVSLSSTAGFTNAGGVTVDFGSSTAMNITGSIDFGSATVNAGTTTLALANNSSLVMTNGISGGSLTVSGMGSLTLGGTNTTWGTTINGASVLALDSNSLGANLVLSSGLLDLGGNTDTFATVGFYGTNYTVTNGAFTVTSGYTASNTTIAQSLTGGATFTSLGGIVYLTNANTYIGATLVTGGTLYSSYNAGTTYTVTNAGSTFVAGAAIDPMWSAAGVGSITLNAGTTLAIDASGTNFALTSSLTNGTNATLGTYGSGTVTLADSQTNYSAISKIAVSSGTLDLGGVAAPSQLTLTNVTISGGTIQNGILSTTNLVITTNAIATIAATLTGTNTLTIASGDLITLATNNNFTGATTVNSNGVLSFNTKGLGNQQSSITVNSGGSLYFTNNGSVTTFTNYFNGTYSYTTNTNTGVVTTNANYALPNLTLNSGASMAVSNGATLNIGSTNQNITLITIAGNLLVGTNGVLNAGSMNYGRSYSINGGGTVNIAAGGTAYFSMYDNVIGSSGGGTNLLTNAGNVNIAGLSSGGALGYGASGLNEIANTGLMTNGQVNLGGATAATATNILVNFASGTLLGVGQSINLGNYANSGVNEFINYGTATEGSIYIGATGSTNAGSFNVVTNTGSLSLAGTFAVGNGGTNNFLCNSGLISNTGGMQVGYSQSANGFNLVTNMTAATMYMGGGITLGNWASTANNQFVNNGTVMLSNNLTVGSGGQVNIFYNTGIVSNSANLQIGWSTNAGGLNAITNTASGNMTMFRVQVGNGAAGTNLFYNAGNFTYNGDGGNSLDIGQSTNSTGLNEIILAGGTWTNTMKNGAGVSPWINIGNSAAKSGTNMFALSGGAQYIGGISGGTNWRYFYIGNQGSQANILTNNGGLITNVNNVFVGNGSSNNANTVYVANGTITTLGGTSGNGITVGYGGQNSTNTLTVATGGLFSGNNVNLGSSGTGNSNQVTVGSGGQISMVGGSIGGGSSSNYNLFQILGSGTVTGSSQLYFGLSGTSNTNVMSVASGGVYSNSSTIQMQGSGVTDLFTNSGGSVTANYLMMGAFGASNSSISYGQSAGSTVIGGGGISLGTYGTNSGSYSTNTVEVAGGTLTSAGGTYLGAAGTNNLNVFQLDNGGQANLAIVSLGATNASYGSGGTNQININSGSTLAAKQFTVGAASSTAGSVNQINLNGGTLLAASGASNNFIGTGVASVAIAGTGTINDNGQAITVGSSIIDGSTSGQLIKTGAGTLTLSGNNTYSTGTLLNAGGVNITSGSSLGSGNLTMADGTTLGYTGTGDSTLANKIILSSGNGTIANSSSSVLTLSGNLSHSGTLLTFAQGSYNVSGNISGAYALSNAAVTLSGLNSYSVPTSIFAGSSLNLGGNGSLAASSALNLGATGDSSKTTNTFNLGGLNQSLSSISAATGGYNQIINSGTQSALLTLTGTSTFNGSINGNNIGLVISGGNVTLGNKNSYIGNTTIDHGTLSLGSAGSLNNTPLVTVTNGGTLLLGGNNQVNTNAGLQLGGTLSMGAQSPSGNRASAQTFSSLTLTGNSVIDFANLTGNSSLTFGSITMNGNLLAIYNWSGTNQWGTQSLTQVGTLTHLYDSNPDSLSSADLNNISFYSGGLGSTFLGNAAFSGNEIVPVPEPGVIVAAVLLLGWMLFMNRGLLLAVFARRRA